MVHAIGDTAASGSTDGGGVRAVRLRIPAKAEYITLCRLALTGLGQVRAIGDDTMADLKLALTEAVSNSVRHAYAASGGGHVDVSYELGHDRIAIEVVGDELSEGGLGIQIIRTIADELEIESAPGRRGSRLRFVKQL